MTSPQVFALPAADKYILYCPSVGASALVNRKARDELALALGAGEDLHTDPGPVGELAALFSSEPLAVDAPQGNLAPMFLGLVPTRSCNLSCGYCDFGSKQAAPVNMRPSLAAAAIDWMAGWQAARGETLMEVHFFGGEPLVAGEAVDVSVHRARQVALDNGLRLHLEISTNGYCDEKRAEFLGDYFNSVVLSLDGFRDTHNLHRSGAGGRGSFDVAARTAAILARSSAELCLRCCVSTHNVDRLEEIVVWFGEEFKPGVINFETVCENEESNRAGIHAPDPTVFARNFLKARRAAMEYGIEAEYASSRIDLVRDSLCPLGRDAVIVFPDGRVFGCYLPEEVWRKAGLELELGRVSENGDVLIDFSAVQGLRRLAAEKEFCRECFCRWSCAGGCLVRSFTPGSRAGYNDFCVQTRLISLVLLLEELGRDDIVEELWKDSELLDATVRRPGFILTPAPGNQSLGGGNGRL